MRTRGIIVLVKSNQQGSIQLIYLIMSLKTCQKLYQNEKQPTLFLFTKPAISLLVGYDLQPTSISAKQNAALVIAHCTSIIRSLCSAPSLCLSCRAQQHSSFIASQVLPVALQHPVLHDELPVRQLHLAPAGVHAADLRVPLHLQLCSHLQHHVPRVAAHLLLL